MNDHEKAWKEWRALSEMTIEAARKRWPAVKIEMCSEDLFVKFGDVSGRVSLSGYPLRPQGRVTSAPALAGTLAFVERGLQDYRTVVDVLHFLLAFVEDFVIDPRSYDE